MKYVIEHLEPKLFEWCMIEYRHISGIVGKENLVFTNLNKTQAAKLKALGECSIKKAGELGLKRVCVLDPAADKTLSPSDKEKFYYLVFGGILGDNPPRARTKEELEMPGAERRNIGKEQFPTDNAVAVCKRIIDGTPMDRLGFMENISVDIAPGEAIDFPFKYLVVKGKPLISEELIEYLKTHDGF